MQSGISILLTSSISAAACSNCKTLSSMPIRSYLSLLIALVFAERELYAQEPPEDLGTGSVVIRQYAFGPGMRANFPVALQDSVQLIMQYTWYVNGNKVFRDNPPSSSAGIPSTDHSVAENRLSYSLIQPRYLIDRATDTTYIFSPDNKRIGAIASAQNTQELFYNRFDKVNQGKVTFPTSQHPVYIASKPCLSGTLETNGQTIQFFYTEDSLPIISPLNAWFPKSFVYPVMAIRANVDWTNLHGQPDIGTLIFQIQEFSGEKPDKKWFQLPDNITIKEITSVYEFYLIQ